MNKRKTIGVMVGNANSPYTTDIMQGIRDAAKECDVNVFNFIGMHASYFFRDFFEKENQEDFEYQSMCIYDYSKLCECDGLIVSYGTLSIYMNERELREFTRNIANTPTVYLEAKIESQSSRYLIADNYQGIKNIMDHLINFHSYKRIVYLSGPVGNDDADDRRLAFMDAMKEAGLEISDTCIEYGDFSESVEAQINSLLDNNPDAEALVCANDNMAITAYEVLDKRAKLYIKAEKAGDTEGMKRYQRHIIGDTSKYGIAVTGYDNTTSAGNVDPPLSSVAQSPYSHGFRAIKTVLGLCENSPNVKSVMASPKAIIRQSCGCKSGRHLEFPAMNERYKSNPELYASTIAEIYTNGLLPAEINESFSNRVYEEMYDILLRNMKKYIGVSNEAFSSDAILNDLKHFINSDAMAYIPNIQFVSSFNDFMTSVLKSTKEKMKKDTLIDAQAKITDYLYSKLYSKAREGLSSYTHRTWFMPLISRDMANSFDSLEKMYSEAMLKMGVLEIGDTYLFVLKESIRHRRNEKWTCPDEVLLVACNENGKVLSYDVDKAPVVSKNELINKYICKDDEAVNFSIFNLYSGEYQYGILVARSKPEDVLSSYYASVQISTALKYCETARAQQKAQHELEKIIREVEEKNEILRSLSEYDQLTGCYNRRGFLEKGYDLIKQNIGKSACMIYADLDHLKEINDRFGHSEGDFAIENAAKNIKASLPESAVISRLGGDEFTALFVLSEGMDPGDFKANISNTAVRFNSMSTKPFYVECSIGYTSFTCEEGTSLEETMALADDYLYEEKGRRRQSIVKRITVF